MRIFLKHISYFNVVFVILIAIVLLWGAGDAGFIYKAHQLDFEKVAREKLKEAAITIDSVFAQAYMLSENMSNEISALSALDEKTLAKIMEKYESPLLTCGLSVIFEDKHNTTHALLLTNENNEEHLIKIHNFSGSAYEQWYGKICYKDTPYWSGTVFDSISGTRIVAFCYPFSLKNDEHGMITFIYTMSDLYQYLLKLGLSRYGLPYIMDSATYFIAHPLDETRSLGDLGREFNDPVLVKIEEEIQSGNIFNQDFKHINTVTGKDCNEAFAYLPQSNWFLGLSIYDGNSLESGIYRKTMRRSSIHLLVSFTIIILFLSIWLRNRYPAIKGSSYFYLFYPFLFLAALVCVINIYNRFPDSQMQNKEHNIERIETSSQSDTFLNKRDISGKWDPAKITDIKSLETFVSNYSVETRQTCEDPLKIIPTGFYIYSLKFLSSYEIQVAGMYWQKYLLPDIEYPVDMLNKYNYCMQGKKGCCFPGAEEIDNTPIDSLEIILEGYPALLYRWNFDIEINQHLSYSLYPFGKNEIVLPIWSVNLDDNSILTPDLDGYKQLYPDVCPGLDNNFKINGWKVQNSFYSYKFESYLCNFGNFDMYGINRFPELMFNITISRKFIDILICKIIPLLVVLVLLFTILFVREENDAFNNVIGCSSLFFVLVFDHINLRESILSENIMYLEYCYFFTYLLLLLMTVTSFNIENMAVKQYYRFADLFLKRYFWAIIMGAMLLATIIIFY